MPEAENIRSFPDIPVSAFAAVLGIAGLGIAWRKSSPVLGSAPWIGEIMIFAGVLVFAWIAIAYGIKITRAPSAMRAEFDDLTQAPFLAVAPLSLQLFAAGAIPLDHAIATLMWVIGTGAQFILLLTIMKRWMAGGHTRRNFHPSIFLPSAGLLICPAIAPQLGFIEIGWMLFAIGVLLWILFLALLFDRLFFSMPMADDETPLLAITVTPPALAFGSYMALNQQMADGFARFLFYTMIFFLIVTLMHSQRIMGLRFSMGWWVLTFPASAAAGAAMEYRLAGINFPVALCMALLGLASVLVIYCAARTLMGLHAGNLFKRIM